MTDIAKGMLVQHASLGVGKVVAVEPTALHVFFPHAEKRYAAKLRLPVAEQLLRTDGVQRDAWLEGLSSFSLDRAEGRYALAASWITHDQAIEHFLKDFPQGFQDPGYLGTAPGARHARAPKWRAAAAEWAATMGGGEGARLLEAGNVKELVKRVKKVGKALAALPAMFDETTFEQALVDPDAALPFLEALFEVLSAPPARSRMEKLFAAVEALDVEPALAWPVVTVLPFLAEPAKHVFLWPRTACTAAERLGCDLRWDAAPNWPTYASLRTFSAQLLTRLGSAGARDFVDVEVFFHEMVAARALGRAKLPREPKRAVRTPAPVAAAKKRR